MSSDSGMWFGEVREVVVVMSSGEVKVCVRKGDENCGMVLLDGKWLVMDPEGGIWDECGGKVVGKMICWVVDVKEVKE